MKNIEHNAEFITLKNHFENSPIAFGILSENFEFIFKNRALLSQYGEFTNDLYSPFIFNEIDIKTVTNYLISEKSYSTKIRFPSGECEVVFSPIFSSQGDIAAISAVFQPADSLTKAQSQNLSQSLEFNREFQDRISMMFSCLYGLSKNQDLDRSAKVCEYINAINQNCYQLLRTSDNISRYLRLSEKSDCANFRLIDLSAFLKKLIDTVIRMDNKNRIPITFNCEGEGFGVSIDIRRMEFAITNILLNSLKYTREGNQISVNLSRSGSYCVISISDLGIGIPKEVLSKLGQPYTAYSHDDKFETGFGLGLFLTKKYIASQGGIFSIVSDENVGTTVTISLPLEKDDNKNGEIIFNAPPVLNFDDKFSLTAIQLSEVCFYPIL